MWMVYVDGMWMWRMWRSEVGAMLLLWRVLGGSRSTVVWYGMYYKVLRTGILVELGYPEYKTVHSSQSAIS